MGVYDSQIATAARLIREKGRVVQLVRRSLTQPDADQPWLTGTPTETSEEVSCVFLSFNNKDSETQHYANQDVHASDRKVLIAGAATNQPPNLSDTLVDGAIRWSIQHVQELAPNGEQILYTLRVRR